MRERTLRSRLLHSVLVLLAAAPAQASILYDVIDLGTWGGEFGWSCARSINDAGQVVGWINDSGATPTFDAVLFDTTGGENSTYLGTIGGPDGDAMWINNSGLIVGYSDRSMSDDTNRATLFHDPTHLPPMDLGSLSSGGSVAFCISNSGQIVGWAEVSVGGPWRAALFDADDPANNRSIGALSLGDSAALSINDAGTAVGWATDAAGNWRAVVFDTTPPGGWGPPPAPLDLGTLGGEEGWAQYVAADGRILGWSDTASGDKHATLFDPDDPDDNVDLGTLGGPFSEAWCTNSHGQIVGWAVTDQPATRATLFDPSGGGQNINLNDLIPPDSNWILKYAYGINEDGWIVGQGIHVPNPAGPIPEDFPYPHAFLLIPIPEPCSLGLLALIGTALLGRTGRSRACRHGPDAGRASSF